MRKGEVSQRQNLVRDGQLEFLHELYERGVPLPDSDIQLLLTHKYITPNLAEKPKKESERKSVAVGDKSYTQQQADKHIDIIEGDSPIFDGDGRHILMPNEAYDKLAETNLFKYQGGKEIHRSDWLPKDKIFHDVEFVNWINSMNKDFQTQTRYKPFAMYCQQADDWLNDNVNLGSFDDDDAKKEYALSEFDRCKENTLYFMDKYLYLKEGDNRGGQRKYLSKPVHKVICYLVDCGYSMYLGKPRQIAATSTIGGIAVSKLIYNKNFFIKFITQDKETGIEIFEDKIKFPFAELPDWMRPSVSNDRDNLFKLGRKTGAKGTKGGVNSKLQVVAPSVSAINGGSPQLVLVDEAGYIKILGRMVKEARPTMFMMNDDTGKLEMKRQIVVWGTGGNMDTGGDAYEKEFYDALDHWNQGDFKHGMIPIFFDWTTRPGITKEFYESEKKVYTVQGPDKEAKMIQFRQTYPSILEDMFLTSQKLLVGIDWINKNKERIQNAEHKIRPVKGYFKPVYDNSQPMPENSDTPFKIVGATFVPLDDLKDDMKMASVEILDHPKSGWKNRYYQGTDPIMTDNGYSNMASVVFDARYNAPVAIVNYRDPNHKSTFLQIMLLGVYYDTEVQKDGIPELVEANIGTAYCDYKESKGFGRSLVLKEELPDYMQGGGQRFGIDNKGNRNTFIINKMYEVLSAYGEKMYFSVIFDQSRTFACEISDSGREKWGVKDPRKHHDDVLFGLVFSYICALCYAHREPYDGTSEDRMFVTRHRLRRLPDGSLTRVEVQEKV